MGLFKTVWFFFCFKTLSKSLQTHEFLSYIKRPFILNLIAPNIFREIRT